MLRKDERHQRDKRRWGREGRRPGWAEAPPPPDGLTATIRRTGAAEAASERKRFFECCCKTFRAQTRDQTGARDAEDAAATAALTPAGSASDWSAVRSVAPSVRSVRSGSWAKLIRLIRCSVRTQHHSPENWDRSRSRTRQRGKPAGSVRRPAGPERPDGAARGPPAGPPAPTTRPHPGQLVIVSPRDRVSMPG